MVFVLLFTLAAFLPVIARATFWSTVSRWEEAAALVAVEAVHRTSEFLAKTPDPAWRPWVEKTQAFLSRVKRERMTLPQVRETLTLLAESGAAILTTAHSLAARHTLQPTQSPVRTADREPRC